MPDKPPPPPAAAVIFPSSVNHPIQQTVYVGVLNGPTTTFQLAAGYTVNFDSTAQITARNALANSDKIANTLVHEQNRHKPGVF